MALKIKRSKADDYRFIISNNETLEKLRSFILSRKQIIAGIGSIVLTIMVLSWVLFVYTPIGSLIESTLVSSSEGRSLLALSKKMGQLENTVRAQNTYIQSIQRLITYHETSGQNPPPLIFDSLMYASDDDFNDILSVDVINHPPSIKDEASEKNSRAKAIEELYLVPPIKGHISAEFLKEKKHLGTDILAPAQTPIKSILNGYVIISDWTINTGYSIGIQHGHGLVSFYKHNSSIHKKTGDFVATGEVIAIIGNTGELSTGPHLHFELWREGKPVNPEDYISFD